MLLADIGANTHFFHEAGPAQQVFSSCRVHHVHFLFAVNEPSKVRFIALKAQEETNLGFCEGHQIVKVLVSWSTQTLIRVKSLTLRNLHGFDLDVTSQDREILEFNVNLFNVVGLYGLLASWARHETKCDPQRGPLVFEQLKNAVGVVDVPTCQLHTWLLSHLTSVTDRAQFILRGQKVST